MTASKNVKCISHAGGHYIARNKARVTILVVISPREILNYFTPNENCIFSFFLSVKIKIKINYFALLLFFKPCYTDVYIYLSRNNGRNWISVSGIVRLANRLFSRLHPRTHTNFHHGLNCFKYRTRDNNPRRWISFMNIFFYISRWARERKEISEIYRGRKLQGFCFVKLLGDGSLRDNDLQIRRIVYI